jgi:hypothetical protein
VGGQGFELTNDRIVISTDAVAGEKLPEGPEAELVFVILHSAGKDVIKLRAQECALPRSAMTGGTEKSSR